MKELKKLPISEQVFERLRKENRLYIDKTEYIDKMIHDGTYYFLSRPRRFGKSLLLSTIEAYFLGKRELFEGLYIGEAEKEWAEHPVLHIDFSLQSYETEQDLHDMLNLYLSKQEAVYGADASETSLALRFGGLIERAYKKTGKGAVILIDEYDKPLLEAIGDGELQERYRKMLRGFYGVLKGLGQYIRFVLLTGITKFSKVSIFSDLNNLNDISRDSAYASICGLTDEEIDRDLEPYIRAFAEKKNKRYEEVRADLKRMYDGYHFVEESVGLYNPYSVMNALSKNKMDKYWFLSGTPTMLVEQLKEKRYSLPKIEEPISAMSLDNKTSNIDNIVPLLYQSGYLSIKRMSEDGNYYWLEFPNDEVRDGFFQFLLPYYTTLSEGSSAFEAGKFVLDVREGNVEQMMQRLESFYAVIPYELEIGSESDFRNAMFILYMLIGAQVSAEFRTSDGRIDLLVRTEKYVYIIECKIDSTADVALEQIKEKEYALPWALDGREKVLIGLNFSTKKRRPDDWVIEREDGSVVRRRECVREQATDQVAGHDTGHDAGHDTGHDVDQVRKLILIVNRDKKSREEIMELLQLKGRDNFRIGYLAPAMEAGYITMTLPDKLKSKKQRYYLTEKGLALLEELKQGNNG